MFTITVVLSTVYRGEKDHRSMVVDCVICANRSENKLFSEPCLDDSLLPDSSSPLARASEGRYHGVARDESDTKWAAVVEAFGKCTNLAVGIAICLLWP